MVERRALIGGSILAGVTGLMAASRTEAASADDCGSMSSSIDSLRKTVEQQFEDVYASKWRGVGRIRQQQHTWMRATQKYPDFIEVGLDVWDNVYDWHVVHQQPVNMTRAVDGHYAMVFMFTTLLLRTDQSSDFVGFAFDAEGARRAR